MFSFSFFFYINDQLHKAQQQYTIIIAHKYEHKKKIIIIKNWCGVGEGKGRVVSVNMFNLLQPT